MTQDRIASAVSRIEQALARVETQAALASSGSAGQGDPEFAARHEALRVRVADSLAELDTLIEGLET